MEQLLNLHLFRLYKFNFSAVLILCICLTLTACGATVSPTSTTLGSTTTVSTTTTLNTTMTTTSLTSTTPAITAVFSPTSNPTASTTTVAPTALNPTSAATLTTVIPSATNNSTVATSSSSTTALPDSGPDGLKAGPTGLAYTFHSIKPKEGYAHVHGWGSYLVWAGTNKPLQLNANPSQTADVVYLYNWQTGQEQRLAESRFKQGGQITPVQISEHWLAWIDYLQTNASPVVQGWYLVAYNLQSHQQIVLDKKQTGSALFEEYAVPDFSLSGDNLVWVKYTVRSGKELGYLVVSNLNTGKTIATIHPNNSEASMGKPSMDGNNVVWQETTTGPNNTAINTIFNFMLNDPQPQNLQLSIPSENAIEPYVSGNYVVWTSGDSDYGAVVLMDLPNLDRQVILSDQTAAYPVVNQYGVSWSSSSFDQVPFYNFKTKKIEMLDQGGVGKVFAGPNMLGWFWSNVRTDPNNFIHAIKVLTFN